MHPWLGERVILYQIQEPLPIQSRTLAPAVQPFVPGSQRPVHERIQALKVVIDPEIKKMPAYSTDKRLVLHGYRLVP